MVGEKIINFHSQDMTLPMVGFFFKPSSQSLPSRLKKERHIGPHLLDLPQGHSVEILVTDTPPIV